MKGRGRLGVMKKVKDGQKRRGKGLRQGGCARKLCVGVSVGPIEMVIDGVSDFFDARSRPLMIG
jgi:hypothetical protein